MQVINIIVTQNGIVYSNDCVIADNQGNIMFGKHIGKRASEVSESMFWNECRKLNPNLPENHQDFDFENSEENAPSFDDGYFEVGNKYVCISWASVE